MAGIEAIGAMLKALETKLPALVESLGVNPRLQKLFALSTHGPEGQAVGEFMAQPVIDRLNQAPVIMRRRSLTDLLANGDLQTVHTSGRTGAKAGTKRSVDIRSMTEPSTFGGHPTYGHLSEDPFAPAKQKLNLEYPDSGTIIKPDSMISQYGRYGFEPRDKSKLTYTLGDSLDQSQWHQLSEFIGDPTYYGAHQEDSAIGALTDHFKDLRNKRAEELGLVPSGYQNGWYAKPQDRAGWTDAQRYEANNKERELLDQFHDEFPDFSSMINYHGYHGIEGGKSSYSGNPLESYPRLIPRRFGEQGLPMSPWEEAHIPDIPKMINGNPGIGYVETQGHGLTTQDIGRVYDYGINPSTATEKKLKNLGIEYVPAAQPDNPLAKINAFVKQKPPRSELADYIESLGPEIDGHTAMKIPDVLRSWKVGQDDIPKVADHYAHGGKV